MSRSHGVGTGRAARPFLGLIEVGRGYRLTSNGGGKSDIAGGQAFVTAGRTSKLRRLKQEKRQSAQGRA